MITFGCQIFFVDDSRKRIFILLFIFCICDMFTILNVTYHVSSSDSLLDFQAMETERIAAIK